MTDKEKKPKIKKKDYDMAKDHLKDFKKDDPDTMVTRWQLESIIKEYEGQ